MAKKDKTDALIEQAYYRLASGRQINIMDIPKVFADCRVSILGSGAVDAAVLKAIDRYCFPV